MLEVTGIDRDRALGWTAGRILQNVLWFTADGDDPDRGGADGGIGCPARVIT